MRNILVAGVLLCDVGAATLLDDTATAIRASVAEIEARYDSFIYQGETVGECEYWDACYSPAQNADGAQIPDWQTSGTMYHTFCDNGTVTTLPEAPYCPALETTVCGTDVSFSAATIKFLTDTDFDEESVQQAVCVQSDLEKQWEVDFDGILDYDNYIEYIYSTVGETGMLMQFPGVEWGTCPSSYDPRFRPWYASAAVGPKNVFLVMDTSGSMGTNGRLALAKEAATKVLGTLNDNDYISIIEFSASARSVSDGLVQYTTNNKCILEDAVDGLFTRSTTNYEAAFQEVFDVYDDAESAGTLTTCGPNVVLFLTDGDVTAGAEGDALMDSIASMKGSRDFHIFTYGLGDDVTTSTIRSIACANDGVAYAVGDDDDLATAMASYFDFFAGMTIPESVTPKWTRYREFNSGIFLASVCMSAHDRSMYEEDGVTRLMGVVCADLAEAHIEAVEGSLSDFTDKLATSASECPGFATLTDEQKETIRSHMPAQDSLLLCNSEILWWYWGIPVIVVGVVILIVIIAVCSAKNKRKSTSSNKSKNPPKAKDYTPSTSETDTVAA